MENNAIIISGANGNVGSYFARKFADKQDNVILIIRNKADRLKDILEKPNVKLIQADLNNFTLLKSKFQQLLKETKWQPEKIIHTATVRSHEFKPLAETDPQVWQDIIQGNIIGTFNLLRVVIPVFRKHSYGKIILFGSNVSRIGLPKGSAYAASKSAIANISRTVAAEEAKNNIIINTVSPGPIKIDESHFSESYRRFRAEYYKEKVKNIPLKRSATFEDLFGLSNFLLSKENSYITGEEFFITGGKL